MAVILLGDPVSGEGAWDILTSSWSLGSQKDRDDCVICYSWGSGGDAEVYQIALDKPLSEVLLYIQNNEKNGVVDIRPLQPKRPDFPFPPQT